jgi:hypothetical protein
MSAYGYSGIPPEEIACGECGGTGELREEIPLEDALKALGR